MFSGDENPFFKKTETARKTALQNYRRIQSEKENGSRFEQHVPILFQNQKEIQRPIRATKPLYSCNKTYVIISLSNLFDVNL